MRQEQIAFNKIDVVHGRNPRLDYGAIEELAKSIKESGLQRPLIVQETSEGNYLLVDGERRYQAYTLLKEQGVPVKNIEAVIHPEDMPEAEILFTVLISNDGKPFLPIEESSAYKRLKDEKISISEMSRRTGKTPHHINNLLALLNASEDLKDLINEKKINPALAVDVVKKAKGDPAKEKALIDEAKEGKEKLKKKMYGFRLPAKQKEIGKAVLGIMANEGYKDDDMSVDESSRKSIVYLTAVLETLASINDGSLSDVMKVAYQS
jgi:ParB family chromosome partitioning protein